MMTDECSGIIRFMCSRFASSQHLLLLVVLRLEAGIIDISTIAYNDSVAVQIAQEKMDLSLFQSVRVLLESRLD